MHIVKYFGRERYYKRANAQMSHLSEYVVHDGAAGRHEHGERQVGGVAN